MPVKFRCHHCRKFMGVSARKRGEAVDCPNCGRRIQVPLQDQEFSTELRESSLLSDPEISNALAQLAELPETFNHQTPQPHPQSAPLATEISKLPVIELVEQTTAFQPLPIEQEQESDRKQLTEHRQQSATKKLPKDKTAQSNLKHRSTLPLLGTGVASFLLGLCVGIWTTSTSSTAPEQSQPQTVDSIESSQTSPETENSVRMIGRVRIQTGQTNSADAGAIVLWIPATRRGEVKMGVSGLRPGDPEADFRIRQAALSQMGITAVHTNRDGQFQMLLSPQQDQAMGLLFVLSRFAPQSAGMPKSEWGAVKKQLESLLDAPEEWIGQRAWSYQRIESSSSALSEPVEVVFAQSE